MGFILRILFSGLIVFVPSEDGKELTVLMLKADHGYTISDGSTLSHHHPMLLARAGTCVGDCATRDPDIAQSLFGDQGSEQKLDSLAAAVSGGGAWMLSDSELSIRKGCSRDAAIQSLAIEENLRSTIEGQRESIPTTAQERQDFSWVPDLKQLCPSGCVLNSALLSATPPQALVAARLRLRNGRVFTYSVARNGSKVTPMHFQTLAGGGASAYTQAVASWVAADIHISGNTVEIVEDRFGGAPGRSMSLAPRENGLVELAVLNLPDLIPPTSPAVAPPTPGKHFEIYYEVVQMPPARENRPVPFAGPTSPAVQFPDIDWDSVRPSEQSELLTYLRLNLDRGVYDRALCPMVQY